MGPECGIKISGSGTCLIEVETSGGLKVVGVLGRFRLSDHENDQTIELMPGELSFLMPGGRGFGDRLNINLEKLIETSYLLLDSQILNLLSMRCKKLLLFKKNR